MQTTTTNAIESKNNSINSWGFQNYIPSDEERRNDAIIDAWKAEKNKKALESFLRKGGARRIVTR